MGCTRAAHVARRWIFQSRGGAPNSRYQFANQKSDKALAHAAPTRWAEGSDEVESGSGVEVSESRIVELGPGVRLQTPAIWAGRIPQPIVEVGETAFGVKMFQALRRAGIRAATQIQAVVWSIASKRDVDIVGISTTGSGKTLAFAVPIISWCSMQEVPTPNHPYALLLSPTRELAQ
mmetsp:Transcript_69658/g.185527  ORF Transcript_69658/g.185527 Transcript_69658/m.185527 type:complete len:177 (-) Transcript_69658:1061-1591(-)